MHTCTYVYKYTCTYNTKNTAHILYIEKLPTNIGHRVGHQSGLNESSGRNWPTFLNGVAFRVYLMFSDIGQDITY